MHEVMPKRSPVRLELADVLMCAQPSAGTLAL
jgi:hypothetical protein